MLVGRFVMGIGVGMAVPAVRRIVILADPERLGNNLGRLLAAEVGGFGAVRRSPLLLAHFGIPVPFLVIDIASIAAAAAAVRTAAAIASASTAMVTIPPISRCRP